MYRRASIVFVLSAFATSAQPVCQLASPGSCVEDLPYLRCRLEESIKALESPIEPLFSDAGHQQCFQFVDQGFCISQPTEMAAYCCRTFSHQCNGNNETLPIPPGEGDLLWDDEDAIGTTTTSTATTLAAVTTDGDLPPEDLCAFVDAASEMGMAITKALREELAFLLDMSATQQARSISELRAGKKSGENNIVIFDPPAEWNAEPIVFNPNIELAANNRPRRRGRSLQGSVDENEQLETEESGETEQSEEATSNLRAPTESAPIISETDDQFGFSTDDDPLGLLVVLGAGGADLLAGLVPTVDFASLNYTRIESDGVLFGSQIAQKLEQCNDCLLQLVEQVFDGAFQIRETSGMTAVQKRRIGKKNEKALIQLTSTEFTRRLVTAFGRFVDELKVEHERWMAAKGISEDLSMDAYLEHMLSALRRVLTEDNLGGIMQNLLGVIGVVNNNLQSAVKADAIKSASQKVYHDIFGCTTDPAYSNLGDANNGQSSSLGPSIEETNEGGAQQRRLITVEGLLGEDHLMASWKKVKLLTRLLQEESPNEENLTPTEEGPTSTGLVNPESPKDTNFIPDLTSTTHGDTIEDGILEGMPCLDRPFDFTVSLRRLYLDLNCNELISAIGCDFERFVLPLKTVVESCPSSWIARCGSELRSAHDAVVVSELLKSSGCIVEAENVSPTPATPTTIEQTTSTTTPTTTIVFTETTDTTVSFIDFDNQFSETAPLTSPTTKSLAVHLSLSSFVLFVSFLALFV